MAGDFFVRAEQRSGPGGWLIFSKDSERGFWGKISKKDSILKISKAEFGIIEVSLYSSRSKKVYDMILRNYWF